MSANRTHAANDNVADPSDQTIEQLRAENAELRQALLQLSSAGAGPTAEAASDAVASAAVSDSSVRAIDSLVRKNPVTSAAAAFGIGLIVARLLSRGGDT